MKSKFLLDYQKALLAHLAERFQSAPPSSGKLAHLAQVAGLRTLDLAMHHEHVLITMVLPGLSGAKRQEAITKAGAFFAAAIIPMDTATRDRDAATHLNSIVKMLSRRTVELSAANLSLQLEIIQRKSAEEALKKSEHHYSHLLKESDRLQQQLRQLSRQILSAQEEERKEISRELHDVIAQTLTGINVRLAVLAKEAAINTKGLDRNIAKTRLLVEKSVDIVHRFARELRPAVLDDLGLIPALHAYLKNFTSRNGIHTRLTAFAGVEKLEMAKRTVLFRVAQEALTNVTRHAKASRVEITIQQHADSVCLKVKDDGRSFKLNHNVPGKGGNRLGLLGMRERLEMVGGAFGIESAPGHGTAITAIVPLGKTAPAKSTPSKTVRSKSLLK